ncbi:MAG: hypothetical protein ABIH69_03970, partial [bacterium]
NLSARAKLAWGIIQESTFDRMGKLKMLAKIAIKLYPAEEKEQARFLARVAQQQDMKASLEGRADMLREMFETVFVEKFKTLRTEEGFHSGLNTFIQEVVDELCRWNPSEGERLAGLIRKPE